METNNLILNSDGTVLIGVSSNANAVIIPDGVKVIGYEGEIRWDTSKPNGTPRKLLDVSKAEALGWKYKTELEEGIRLSYEDFLNNPMRAER